MSNKEYIVNWDTSDVTSVKNKTTLVFEGAKLNDLGFTLKDKILTCTKGDKSVKFSNFSKIKYAKTNEAGTEFTTTNLIAVDIVVNLDVYDTPTKNKVTGTKYNDTVDISAFVRFDAHGNEVIDPFKKVQGIKITTSSGADTVTATKYSDTINSGDGNDFIYSTEGNDKIAGGKGINKVKYSGKFDTDTISLTKTEQLTIDLKSYGLTKVSDLTFTTTSKDLVIKVEKSGTIYGTIVLKNFKKSNVVGANGKVLLDIGLVNPIDLNDYSFLLWDKTDFSSKGVFTGTRFSETIDASGVSTAYGKNNKGVTISGGAGYNTIIGTNGFNDTIKGGNDGNNISVGEGNNKITTGSGIDSITLNAGENTVKSGAGDDEITVKSVTSADLYAGAGVNTITIDNSADFGKVILREEKAKAVNNIVFTSADLSNYYLNRNGNSLILATDNNSSSLTVNSYFSDGKKYAQKNFFVDGHLAFLDDLITMTKGFVINGKGTILGTDYDDAIVADDYTLSKASNDNITPKKGKDSINAGKGNNVINIAKGDGTKTIIDGGGVDTLAFESGVTLTYGFSGKSLIIYYGEGDDKVIIKDYSESASVEYIKVGNKKEALSTYCVALARGSEQKEITINTSVATKLILTDTFDNKDYVYTLKSLSGDQNIELEYLLNGRLYIKGDYALITASDAQADDIILMGEHNSINTGDENDTVRLGYVVDSKGEVKEYIKQSDNNIINTGAGDDYVTYFGLKNATDTGVGDDKVLIIGKEAVISEENIVNAETIRKTDTQLPVNNAINWFDQGEGGGDCRLFALLDSLNRSENFSLDDYVTIVDNSDDTYTVTFKNYDHPNNSKTVALSDLDDFTNVYGDLDVVLIDYALNRLIDENRDMGLDTVQKAYYNTIAEYIFGKGPNMTEVGENTGDVTVTDYSNPDYDTRLNTLWALYQNGEIDNLTVGIQPRRPDDSDYKLGVLTAHAYSIKDFGDGYITLVNPWDNADVLNLDYSFFKTFDTCIIAYGVDYYDEYMLVDNGYKTRESNDFDFYISDISSEAANWLMSSKNEMTEIVYSTDYKKDMAEVLCINTSTDLPQSPLTF